MLLPLLLLLALPLGLGSGIHRQESLPVLLTQSRQDRLPILYKVFEHEMLSWLADDVKLIEPVDQGDSHATLKAHKEDLETRISTMKTQIKRLNLVTLYETLAELEKEHQDTLKKLEEAEVPHHKQMESTVSVVKQLRDNPNDQDLRGRVRQQIRLVLNRIVVENITRTEHTKLYRFRAELANGQTYLIEYETDHKAHLLETRVHYQRGHTLP